MTDLVTIGKVQAPLVTYKGQRVCTTQQLAQFYGCTARNLTDNHQRNAGKFEEGKHYVKVEGEDLRALKAHYTAQSGVVAERARHVFLWTERGAARHAKMLETDKAWDVFELLEDEYFGSAKRPADPEEAPLSTKRERLPLYHFAVDQVIRHHLLFSKVYSLMNAFAGSPSFQDMTKEQVAETVGFCDRFAVGQDTRNDWRRITENQAKLQGPPQQMDMVYLLMVAPEPVQLPERGPAANAPRQAKKA